MVLTVISSLFISANAADMQCFVDTAAFDEPRIGNCPNIEFTFDNRPNTAVWQIINITKTIQEVIWQEATAGCSSSATTCSMSITPFQLHTGRAVILYTDGTFETVSAVASFETGF